MTRPDFSHADEEMARYEIPGEVLVVFGWIGEGRQGDFDEEDKDDVPFLRFDAYDLKCPEDERDRECRSSQDNSYCTCLPAWTPLDVLESVCKAIAEAIFSESHWKRLLEEWSWVDLEDAEKIHSRGKQ